MGSEQGGGNGGTDEDNGTPPTSTYAAVGLQFAISLVLFALAGNWLDKKLATSPVFLLVGVFGGGAAAFYSMYRKLVAPQGRKPEKR